MLLPQARGSVSRQVLAAMSGETVTAPTSVPAASLIEDEDAQLALWMLYQLHYRGFDGVAGDLEWDPELITLRRSLEDRFERELREGCHTLLESLPLGGAVDEAVFALVAGDDSPSPAAFIRRDASREQVLDFLRERSVQQLQESDPQAFVLPRLTGPAKVALAELLYDEFGAGRPEHLHQTLYADALTAAGLDPTDGAYIDEVSALSLANANVASMFALNRRLHAAAMGHFAAFEATSSAPSRKIAAGIERVGLPAAVAAYFHEHVEADAVHEQVAVRDICATLVAEDPSLRDDVLFGAASCLHLEGLSSRELLQRWTTTLEEAS